MSRESLNWIWKKTTILMTCARKTLIQFEVKVVILSGLSCSSISLSFGSDWDVSWMFVFIFVLTSLHLVRKIERDCNGTFKVANKEEFILAMKEVLEQKRAIWTLWLTRNFRNHSLHRFPCVDYLYRMGVKSSRIKWQRMLPNRKESRVVPQILFPEMCPRFHRDLLRSLQSFFTVLRHVFLRRPRIVDFIVWHKQQWIIEGLEPLSRFPRDVLIYCIGNSAKNIFIKRLLLEKLILRF